MTQVVYSAGTTCPVLGTLCPLYEDSSRHRSWHPRALEPVPSDAEQGRPALREGHETLLTSGGSWRMGRE